MLNHSDQEINEAVEQNLRYHEDCEENIRGPHLLTAFPLAHQIAELESFLPPDDSQGPIEQNRNQHTFLRPTSSNNSHARSSGHMSRGVSSHNVEVRSFHEEGPHQSVLFHEKPCPLPQHVSKSFKSRALPGDHSLTYVQSEIFSSNLDANPLVGSAKTAPLTGFYDQVQELDQLLPLHKLFEPLVAKAIGNLENILPVNLDYLDFGPNPLGGNAELEEEAISDKEPSPQLQHLSKPFKPRVLRSANKNTTPHQGIGNSLDGDKPRVLRSARKQKAQPQNAGESSDAGPPVGSAQWKALNDPPEGSSQRKAAWLSSLSIRDSSRLSSLPWPPAACDYRERVHQDVVPWMLVEPPIEPLEPLPSPGAVAKDKSQAENLGYISNANSGYEANSFHLKLSEMNPGELENLLIALHEADFRDSDVKLLNETNSSTPVENEDFNLQGFVYNNPNYNQDIEFKYPTFFDAGGNDSEEMSSTRVAKRNMNDNCYLEPENSIVVDRPLTLSDTTLGQSGIQNYINQAHSDLGNEKFKGAGQEYLMLRYVVPQPLSLPLYQRFQGIVRLLGPDVVGWLEYNAKKTGFVKAREATEKELIKTKEDGYMTPLGYNPLDGNLMAEQEKQEVERCHNAAAEVFGIGAFEGGNEGIIRQTHRPNFTEGLGISSEEFNALLDETYLVDHPEQKSRVITDDIGMNDIQIGRNALANNLSDMDVDSESIVDEHPAKRPKLSTKDRIKPKAKPIAMSQSLPHILTVATPEKGGRRQNDSPTSTVSFRTAVMDVQDSEEGEISLVPTRAALIVPKPPVKDQFAKSGSRIGDTGGSDEGQNEVSIFMTTPKKVTLPAVKSTKSIFAAVKTRSQSQNQGIPSQVSRTTSAPQSAEWSWGKAVDIGAGLSYREIVPRGSTEVTRSGLRNSENINIAQNDQSLSRVGSVHFHKARDLGSRPQSHYRKPSQSNQPPQQSRGYPSNLAVDATPTQTSSRSFATQAKSDQGKCLTGDKHSSRPAAQTPIVNLTESPSPGHASQQRFSTLKTPETAHKSFSRTSSILAKSRMQSHQPLHSADNSTMSTRTTPTNEGSMIGQQSSSIPPYNSLILTGYGTGIPSGSSSRPAARSTNNISVQPSFAPTSQLRPRPREVAYGSFGTVIDRAWAARVFNNAVTRNPQRYRNLMIVTDPNADPADLEISGPLGSNVRGAMREILPGYRFFAKLN
jgi:hypothetical protein